MPASLTGILGFSYFDFLAWVLHDQTATSIAIQTGWYPQDLPPPQMSLLKYSRLARIRMHRASPGGALELDDSARVAVRSSAEGLWRSGAVPISAVAFVSGALQLALRTRPGHLT